MSDDLWPADIGESRLTPPVALLKEQADLLGDKTRQLVTADVLTRTSGNLFVHTFCILAPTLDYKFEMFSIVHGINFYPITFRYSHQDTIITNEDEFKEKLKATFSSPHTLNTIHSILAQVRA